MVVLTGNVVAATESAGSEEEYGCCSRKNAREGEGCP
jgi:hypothetical protein